MPFALFLLPFARRAARFAGITAIAAFLCAGLSAAALADSADGTITRLDENDNTVTLDNGKVYKLPGEFDYSDFHVGQKVSLFYDSDPSGSYVTDIEVQGAQAADTEPANTAATAAEGGGARR